ncbi:unnamed protein product, partial [Mesorhabditis spiculigera]
MDFPANQEEYFRRIEEFAVETPDGIHYPYEQYLYPDERPIGAGKMKNTRPQTAKTRHVSAPVRKAKVLLNSTMATATNDELLNVLDRLFSILAPGVEKATINITPLDETPLSLDVPYGVIKRRAANWVLNEIDRSMQSSKPVLNLVGEWLEVTAQIVEPCVPVASGRPKTRIELMSGKNSRVLTDPKGTSLCLPKAFALGLAYSKLERSRGTAVHTLSKSRWDNLLKKPKLLEAAARKVMIKVGIVKERNYVYGDLVKLQEGYSCHRLMVFNTGGIPFFNSPRTEGMSTKRTISLCLDDRITGRGHYMHIKRLNRFLGSGYHCSVCNVKYNEQASHYRCPLKCTMCGLQTSDGNLSGCVGDGDMVPIHNCRKCLRSFYTITCYDRHVKPASGGVSWCDRAEKCSKCHTTLRMGRASGELHECGTTFCKTCHQKHTEAKAHFCAITCSDRFGIHQMTDSERQKHDNKLRASEEYRRSLMTDEQRWYNMKVAAGSSFNMKAMLEKYCLQDVTLLAEGVWKFSTSFSAYLKVDPLSEATTIASAAMLVFRRLFVNPNLPPVIALSIESIVSKTGTQSKLGLAYLEYLRLTVEPDMRHAGTSGGEFTVPGTMYKVDGYVPATSTRKSKIWKLREKDMDVDTFFLTCDFSEPLSPREWFYGGRVEVFRTRAIADKRTVLEYFDYCSLYPYVNKYSAYPIGPPQTVDPGEIMLPILPGELIPLKGAMRCKVLPPVDLHVPVLPYRSKRGALVFGLCRTCMEEIYADKCPHNNHERAIIGAWATVELQKALEKGYTIVEIYQAVSWDKWSRWERHVDGTITQGPFSGYIDRMLKLKTEASGYPGWVFEAETTDKVESNKELYVENYFENEGIRLEHSAIRRNPELRQVAKLLANSLWGKTGQRTNMPKSEFISDPSKLWRMLDNPGLEILDLELVNPMLMHLKYVEIVEACKRVLPYVAVHYAALTTAYARLRLYEALERVNSEDLIYTDTDSIVIKRHVNATDTKHPLAPLIGDFLGQLVNEIPIVLHLNMQLAWPSCMLLCGPSSCGKTTLLREIIDRCDTLYCERPRIIIFAYNEYQPGYDAFASRQNIKMIEDDNENPIEAFMVPKCLQKSM